VRVGFRTLVSLALCAATAAAALAHVAIDVAGDYALKVDSYDNLSHGSRELVSLIAVALAFVLAARGLRLCCEIAQVNRTRIVAPGHPLREGLVFILMSVAASVALVPAMEWLDGRLNGVPVRELNDAFGGSLALGVGITIFCAAAIALVAYGIARWLISHRDSIAAIIETLLGRTVGGAHPAGYDLARQLSWPRRKRTLYALRLSKRGPPAAIPA
jgi:hypothetical protein